MTVLDLLRDRKIFVVSILLLAFAILFFFFNIFVVGGDAFVSQVDSLVSPLIGGLACTLLFPLVRDRKQSDSSRKVYRWFLTGLILWLIAESAWAFYVFVLKEEAPFPSLADVFWLAGYPPLFIGFITRSRSYGVTLIKRDRWLLAGMTAMVLLVTFVFVISPILRDYDPQRYIENILNISYPLMDLILLILMLVILFTLEKGKLFLPWLLITIGFTSVGISDLVFSYASSIGLYYPEGKATFLSVFIDVLYNIVYLALILAFYVIRKLSSAPVGIPFQSLVIPATPLVVDANFVLFTDKHNTIMEASENIYPLLGLNETAKVIGVALNEVLGIDSQELAAAFDSMIKRGYLSDWEVTIARTDGQARLVRLTAFPTFDSLIGYTGANVVLRATLDPSFPTPALSRETTILVQNILLKAGVLEREREKTERKSLEDYFTAKMGVLFALVADESSLRVARAMDAACVGVAQQEGWEVQFEGGRTTIGPDMSLPALKQALPHLLDFAIDYSKRVVREGRVLAEFKKIDQVMALTLDLELMESVGLRK